jgi:L-seryl-tRNA(Ser) seleniumtransferase
VVPAVFKTVGRAGVRRQVRFLPLPEMNETDLSRLPQIERLLGNPRLAPWIARLSRPLVARLASETVASFRESLRAAGPAQAAAGAAEVEQAVLSRLEASCRKTARRRLGRVINATGVVLHTNLGRAPLPAEAWDAARAANTGYSSLEFDLDAGSRGQRGVLAGELCALATGAQAALAVNNNAAALFLILSCFARRREVLVSRGEQVQIGGGFRIPEILALSGARLVEVGTTNLTTVEDYTEAAGLATAMALVVHASNFRIRGFTERPSLESLARALPKDVLLVVDQGSGALSEGVRGEQAAGRYLEAGAHLVCFSADKLLGGPQAGLIAGRADLVQALARHPLLRVFRPGKTVLSLLEECLVRRLNGSAGPAEALSLSLEELQRRGRRVLRGLPAGRARLVPAAMTPGGGSAPDEDYPSLAVELSADAQIDAPTLLARLREWDPPIVGTVAEGKVLLNLAAVLPEELPVLRAALLSVLG